MKKVIKATAFLLMLVFISTMLFSCVGNTGKILMQLDGQSVSVNLYEFYLSRVKGTLASYGYDLTSEEFWNTVIDMDGTTWEDYYHEKVLDETKESLVILKLFADLEKEGKVKFTDESKQDIDELVNELAELDADGSKSGFNSILAEYGANIHVLKLAYEIEMKKDMLVTYYFGSNGSQISETVKEEYMRENYIAFKQILIAKFHYEYVCDENGDAIYYTDTGKIAYDKVNGKQQFDKDGNPLYDKDGNFIYCYEDGSVAYDIVNGKRQAITDENGNAKITYYSESELEEKLDLVEEIVDGLVDNDTAKFEYNMYKYAEYANANVDDLQYAYYLKKNETSAYDYINTIRDALNEINVGEIRVVPSDYGYHIVMKYELEKGAYSDENNSTWFVNFNSEITSKLLKTHTEEDKLRVEVDSDLIKDVSILDVGINFYY